MFVQLGSSETHSVAGLGLGLALARSFITLHGGEITAHSAGLRKGSEFRIRLPLADAPAHDRDAPDITPQVHTARRVLIVDDNVDAATSLATLLEYKGHSVRTCFDGSTAFEAAAHSPPDVAFIDLNMPDPDGAALANMIRSEPWGQSVKLVALTVWDRKPTSSEPGQRTSISTSPSPPIPTICFAPLRPLREIADVRA